MATKHTFHRRTTNVTGPHAGYDRYGRFDHLYWRCERCGLESTSAALRDGCPRCEPRESACPHGAGVGPARDAGDRRDPAGFDADA
jgi:hypothetical protein